MSPAARAWALWADWCTATGHDATTPTPDALERFATQVPGTAAALVPGEVARRTLPLPPGPDPWVSIEPNWAPLRTALTRCPAYGWPRAVPGRRDAWLLVATRGLRLTRRHAVGLRAHDLPSLLDRLPTPSLGEPCARCIALRWLDVVDTHAQWSRASVRTKVWTRPPGTWSPASIGSAVPCNRSCDSLPTLLAGLPGHTVIAPAVDRHGWWTDWRPLSARALTSILAHRCDPYGAAPAVDEPVSESPRPVAEFDDSTFDRLDAAISAADEVNARLEALLAEYDM